MPLVSSIYCVLCKMSDGRIELDGAEGAGSAMLTDDNDSGRTEDADSGRMDDADLEKTDDADSERRDDADSEKTDDTDSVWTDDALKGWMLQKGWLMLIREGYKRRMILILCGWMVMIQ